MAATLSADTISYTIDPTQSLIKYLATGPLNSQFPGTFKVTGQTVTLTPERDGYRVKLALDFDLKSATATDSFMRNTLLSSLDVDHYPTATLNLSSKDVVQMGSNSAAVSMNGTYALHGLVKSVELLMTLSAQSSTLTLSGDMTFKLSDYNVQISGFVVNDLITFSADLTAKRD